ncbi:MAG: PSD1 and planctomycete cytochrome C domain-containing protein [Gemmataceae bacterium]
MRLLAFSTAMGLIFGSLGFVRAEELPKKIEFNRDIRPILSNNCFSCHGPDKHERKADLRLDVREAATEDLGGYHAILPGKAKDSEVMFRITSKRSTRVMPPPKTGKKLTKHQIALIERWIDQGAEWQDHWSFVPPQRASLPKVKDEKWVRNPIDQFVLARLEKNKLTTTAEADRRTLIRRVTLDLIGLPPTPTEVENFVNDESPEAYEKVVDRLLGSKHYGEHQARYWLDAARYGDTHGMHLDNYREMWPFRDWVINAFNTNKPYDRFVVEQLAGDLLPNRTTDQLVATGFNRAHVTTNEGGSIREEVFVRNVVDRVETFGTVFMGLTVGCATCHDHKYDPVSQKEFYQLFAFFNSLDGNPMDGNRAQHAPVVRVPSLEQKGQLAALETKLAAVRQEIREKAESFEYVEPKNPSKPVLPEPTEKVWVEDTTPVGARLEGGWKWVSSPKPVFSGKRATTRTENAVGQHYFTGAQEQLVVGKGDRLFTYVYLDPKNPPKEIMLQWNDGDWDQRAYWGSNQIPFGRDNQSRWRQGNLPKAGEWVRLEIPAQKVNLKPGAKINGWAFTQFGGTVYWDKAGIVKMPDPSKLNFDSYAQWIDYQRKIKVSTLPKNIHSLVKKPKRNAAEQKALRTYFIKNVYVGARKVFAPLRAQLAKLEKFKKTVSGQMGTTLVWKETKKPRPAYLLKRGAYDARGEQVDRFTPEALPAFKKGWSQDRLGLAKWLVSREHPLTARVFVNRIWQQHFGTGIVKTAEDFGNQGDLPSHPQLLDWLSVEFQEKGWDIKALHKMIVMSTTYRQSSKVSDELKTRDPENRLLARGPSVRLDAEVIRDQALALSGLLVRRVGGPSVRPPQPLGLWKAVGYSGSNTVRFKRDFGAEKVFRRSLYTFWKRTSPPPQMAIFDAPSREQCRVRRERTNTPLQALVTLNERQFVECARHLGQRIMKEGGKTTEDRIKWAYHLATARYPSEADLKDLVDTYDFCFKEFSGKPKEAQELIKYGDTLPDASLDPVELASWTVVANTLLNLHEVVNKS